MRNVTLWPVQQQEDVVALVEAAFKSLDRSPETERQVAELRKRHAFEAVITPSNPDDAAVPMLNGKPFNVTEMAELSAEEPEDSEDDSQQTSERTLLASNTAPAKTVKVMKVTAIPDRSAEGDGAAESRILPFEEGDATAIRVSMSADDDALSVSEYEERQFGSTGAGGGK